MIILTYLALILGPGNEGFLGTEGIFDFCCYRSGFKSTMICNGIFQSFLSSRKDVLARTV